MKYLKFLLLVTMFTVFISVPCYASTLQNLQDLPSWDNLTQHHTSHTKYAIFIANYHSEPSEWVCYLAFYSDNEVGLYSNKDYQYTLDCSYYTCKNGDTSWNYYGSTPNFYFGIDPDTYQKQDRYIFFAETDLVSLYDTSQVLFQRAPIKSVGAIQISKFQIQKALKQVVYLTPCLISFLVGLVAFRKGWNWLKTQFQT